MKGKVKIGVCCLTRHTFDFAAAMEIYKQTQIDLKQIENVEYVFIEDEVVEVEDARAAGLRFKEADVDGVIIISGTFHLGHLALTIDNIVKQPILLWAYDELPYDGGKIRLNAVCGVNLNASNLYKSGNDTYHCIVGDQVDQDWIDALRMKRAISKSHIGILGYRAHGFFNLGVDELRMFKETGILLDHYEIVDMYNQAYSDEELQTAKKLVVDLFDTSSVSEKQVELVSKLVASARKFMDVNQLDAVAVRCWPEFASYYGISPCAAMSILQSLGYVMACEGDVEGAISMLATRAAGAETPFLADLSQVNRTEDFALMWHCGVAPVNLCNGSCNCSLDTYFAGGKGVTADFVLKSGAVNIMRIDSARGKTRVFYASGKAQDMDKLLRGTYAKVTFDVHINRLLEVVTSTGVAHHVALVYGNYENVYKLFARMCEWETIQC